MARFIVKVYGSRTRYSAFECVVDVEASSEEEALTRAKDLAANGQVDWNELPEDYHEDAEVKVSSAEFDDEQIEEDDET